ncbi:hypothetical protein TVAGG3_0691470, partial [Trichomonas vaginalis G3]|uniref:hypothetical protein n=1 Tax=Trichomonas vaginalis (strain ATCC PRA-98 / G3) TaxID=412133 RepID=UPI0021E61490
MREIFMKKEKNISFIVAANPLINSNEISKKLSLIGNKQFISMPTKSINFMDLQTSEEKELFRINHFNYTYKVRDIPEMIEFAIIEYEINLNDEDEKQCMMTIIETELTKNYGDDDTTTKQKRKKNDGFSANLESKQRFVIQDCIWELYKVIYNIIREKAAISYRNAIHFSHIFKLVYKQTGNFELALSVGIYMRFILPYTTNAEFIDDKDDKDDKSSNFTINNLKKYWEFSNLFDEKDKDKDVEERNFRADFVQFLNPGFAKIDNKAEYLQNGENKMLNVDVQGYITHEANKILNKAFKDHLNKNYNFDIQKKMYEYSFAQCYKYIPEPKILKLNSIMFNLAALDIGYNIFHYMHELLPILLIAKPGTAKSLAVEYFKIYHYKPVTNETSNEPGESNDFYCSTFLTSIISQTSCLESHFYDCMRHHHRDNQVRLYTAMVFLDELGFGNLNPSLYIKELYYIFDKGIHYKIKTDQQNTGLSDDISDISEKFEKIFPVGASNYQIDHAIM